MQFAGIFALAWTALAIYLMTKANSEATDLSGRPTTADVYEGFDWVLYPAISLGIGYGVGYVTAILVQWIGRYAIALKRVAEGLDDTDPAN